MQDLRGVVSQKPVRHNFGVSGGWLERAQEFARRGEVLLAVDHADRGLAEDPEDIRLQHIAVLALARAGAVDTAVRRFAEGSACAL